MWAVIVYSWWFVKDREPLWFAVDGALVVAGFAVAFRREDLLGFRSLGENRRLKLVLITLFSTFCVWACQRIIRDWNMVALDESHYLLTLREKAIITDGLLPFNVRWLVPFLAGPLNILPVADAAAIKAINFGAFVLTAVGLILLFVRLRVPLWMALAAPVFLLGSYLGIYGSHNRLVLDPSNYAFYVLMFHCLLRRAHWPFFAIVLFVDALNAEKAIYWLPVFVFVELLREPWSKQHLREVAKLSLFALGPSILYMGGLWLSLTSSRLEANLCFENLHLMSFSNLGGVITPNVDQNNFQTLWMPFGGFSLFALLGFALDDRRELKPIGLLLIPIFIQAVIACDTDRMLAYSFIVYIPFGYLYLERAMRDIPRAIWVPAFVALVTVVLLVHFYLPAIDKWGYRPYFNLEVTKMTLSALQIAIVAGIVFVHFTLFRRRE